MIIGRSYNHLGFSDMDNERDYCDEMGSLETEIVTTLREYVRSKRTFDAWASHLERLYDSYEDVCKAYVGTQNEQ